MAIGANRYTTTELVADIQRLGHIPPSQRDFGADNLLAIANTELETCVLKQILSTSENYYLTFEEFELVEDNTYSIPTRAIGAALVKVQLFNGTTIYEIARTEISQQFSTIASPSGNFSFFIQGNYIILRPNPQVGTLRLWYLMHPNRMVETNAAAQVSAINGNTVTVSSIPSTFTTATPMDMIQDQPHFNWISIDQTPTNISGLDITFDAVSSDLRVGDWLALAGQTPVPQIPVEFRPLVAQRVVVKYYESQNYLDKMKAAQAKLKEMEDAVFMLINPRISEEPKRLIAGRNIIGGFNRWLSWSSGRN